MKEVKIQAIEVYRNKEIKTSLENSPDLLYTYKIISPLPRIIVDTGNWIIKVRGKGKLCFCENKITPY